MSEKKKMKGEASSSSNSNNSADSEVVDVGLRRSSCGYCKSGVSSSISHGLWARSLTVDDYQAKALTLCGTYSYGPLAHVDAASLLIENARSPMYISIEATVSFSCDSALLDRGWRRSGCFLYKPEMEKTCCPSYTIRLKASDFVPSKEQRRVLKRMQRFLDGTLDKSSDHLLDATDTSGDSQTTTSSQSRSLAATKSLTGNLEEKYKTEPLIPHMESEIDKAVHVCIESEELSSDFQFPKASVKKVAPAKRKLSTDGSEDLLFTSSISFQIAATLRRQRKDVEHEKSSELGAGERGQAADTPKVIAEKLATHLNCLAESLGLLVRACNGHINFYSSERRVEKDAAVSNHNESKKFSSTALENPELKRRRFEVRLKRSSFDPEEYSLYRRYQIRVHNDSPDEVTESSYRRFLVDTPLIFVPPSGDLTVPPCGFGSFHQQYLIDGRLVAVGVIDILPKCLSSKYLFWDPDLAFLSLGKYSALQEIKWVSQNQVYCPSLQYYYLGYYIHSCSKMRYKAAYRPSELLCPLRYQSASIFFLEKAGCSVLRFQCTIGTTFCWSCLEYGFEDEGKNMLHMIISFVRPRDEEMLRVSKMAFGIALYVIDWTCWSTDEKKPPRIRKVQKEERRKKKEERRKKKEERRKKKEERRKKKEERRKKKEERRTKKEERRKPSRASSEEKEWRKRKKKRERNYLNRALQNPSRASEVVVFTNTWWVPLDIVKPLLDRKPYMVLSDFATQNGEPLPPSTLENCEEQNDEQHFHRSNDIFVGEDEEMDEFNYEDSDDELVAENSDIQLPNVEDRDVGSILIGLKEVHLRYKDLRQAFGSSERRYMETQLHRYMRAVGAELSERMVYSLG
ncbi:hypothetical protein RND71_030676 [Anisodus tanguticus]|uniref:arginyltransferase n=1 Tax=Anisodus tanguticus TaxID=243964 RepID=A0AAE1RI11_9SOLA|nr:hypothetical protein RND71_030676 [Anisodus tanguticus]